MVGRPATDPDTQKCKECETIFTNNGRNSHIKSDFCNSNCRIKFHGRKWRKKQCNKCNKKKMCTVITFGKETKLCFNHLSDFIDAGLKKK